MAGADKKKLEELQQLAQQLAKDHRLSPRHARELADGATRIAAMDSVDLAATKSSVYAAARGPQNPVHGPLLMLVAAAQEELAPSDAPAGEGLTDESELGAGDVVGYAARRCGVEGKEDLAELEKFAKLGPKAFEEQVEKLHSQRKHGPMDAAKLMLAAARAIDAEDAAAAASAGARPAAPAPGAGGGEAEPEPEE